MAIFFAADHNISIDRVKRTHDVVRVLANDDNDWALRGTDYLFAEYFLEIGGVLNISEAVVEDGKVKIIGDPLKHFENYISKIDRHGCNAKVEIHFNDKSFAVWLPFAVH